MWGKGSGFKCGCSGVNGKALVVLLGFAGVATWLHSSVVSSQNYGVQGLGFRVEGLGFRALGQHKNL